LLCIIHEPLLSGFLSPSTTANPISLFAPQQTPLSPNITANMASDLETLLDMGFDKERAEIAVKKTGGRMYS